MLKDSFIKEKWFLFSASRCRSRQQTSVSTPLRTHTHTRTHSRTGEKRHASAGGGSRGGDERGCIQHRHTAISAPEKNRQSLAYLAYYVWQIDTQPGAMFGLKMHKTAFDDRHAEGAPKPPS